MSQQDQRWIEDATQSERQAQVKMQAQAQRMKEVISTVVMTQRASRYNQWISSPNDQEVEIGN